MAGYWNNYPSRGYHYYTGYYGPYYGQFKRSDQEIQRDIWHCLEMDSWVNASQINVDVRNGVVTLTGTVSSITEKRAAGDDAWDTPGVVDVNNQLRIVR